MDKTKSTTTTASGTSSRFTTNKLKKSSPPPTTTANTVHSTAAAAITTSSNTVLSRRVHRVLQDFLVIWLDSNVDESKNDFKKSIQRLRHIVASVITFTDVQECIDFLSEIKNERVYMIVSGSVGRHLIPEIYTWPQLNSIYIFCGKQSVHEEWAKAISKIKGVYTKIKPICKALQIDREQCDQAMISISFHGIDALFMCTPLLKEVFSEIDDDKAKSIKELVDYCRLQDDIPENEIANVEQEYNLHKPIWWYTAPCFISSMLNREFIQEKCLILDEYLPHTWSRIMNSMAQMPYDAVKYKPKSNNNSLSQTPKLNDTTTTTIALSPINTNENEP
ncbi:unnamed protein product [Rotaria sp. Silwood1]|nr:unnamed protein product [Rotaria sp. Silwood1]CAF0931070.1 unnamed protein product [Rotaria sp. Silwood1]